MLFSLSVASTVNAQLASDNISRYGKQKMKELPPSQHNVRHNTLTASNKNLLPSNLISKSYQQKIPASMRSRVPIRSDNYPRNKPRILASNSPRLKAKKFPKRSPALPVVF